MRQLSLILIVSTLVLSGCAGAAVGALPAATAGITITVGDLVIGLGGIRDTIPLEEVLRNNPDLLKDYPELADTAHAEAQHGVGIVDVVDNCLKSRGAIKTMYNPVKGRTARVCLEEGGRFIVKIVEQNGDLVTAFFKEKMKTLDQVIRYLSNRGYVE